MYALPSYEYFKCNDLKENAIVAIDSISTLSAIVPGSKPVITINETVLTIPLFAVSLFDRSIHEMHFTRTSN
jgi:hypothetical protein